jgi:hypothetical protein
MTPAPMPWDKPKAKSGEEEPKRARLYRTAARKDRLFE